MQEHTTNYLNNIFIEHEMELCVSLFLHPPVVHVVVPRSKHHWHNRWIKKSLNITSNARTHIRILNTYSFHPWISGHSHSTLQAPVISSSCARNGNRRPHCPLHCEQCRQSTQQTYFIHYFHTHFDCFWVWSDTQVTNPAVLLPNWLWYKLDWKMSP